MEAPVDAAERSEYAVGEIVTLPDGTVVRVEENPSQVDTANVLSNPDRLALPARAARGAGRGFVANVRQNAIPLAIDGVAIGGGFVAGNAFRSYVSVPVTNAIFGEDSTPNEAILVDWLLQVGAAVLLVSTGNRRAAQIAMGMVANTVMATGKQLTAKAGQPNPLFEVTIFGGGVAPGGRTGPGPRVRGVRGGIFPKMRR